MESHGSTQCTHDDHPAAAGLGNLFETTWTGRVDNPVVDNPILVNTAAPRARGNSYPPARSTVYFPGLSPLGRRGLGATLLLRFVAFRFMRYTCGVGASNTCVLPQRVAALPPQPGVCELRRWRIAPAAFAAVALSAAPVLLSCRRLRPSPTRLSPRLSPSFLFNNSTGKLVTGRYLFHR